MLFIAAVLLAVALTILMCALAIVIVMFLVFGVGWAGTALAAAGGRSRRDSARAPARAKE